MARRDSFWRRLTGWITMERWERLQMASLQLGIAVLVIAFIVLFAFIGMVYYTGVFPDWTGFGPPLLDAQGKEVPHEKTLWDWMGLLLIPVVLAIAGYFLTRSENRYALQLQARREAEARKLEAERAQDAALQAYLDQMTQLLLHERLPLRPSQPDDEVRSVARARTLTVLRVLDGVRKATVVQFLYEARLIGGLKQEEGRVVGSIDAIVSLDGAHLEQANLSGAYLEQANLSGAHLEQANLSGANLEGANLNLANLEGAHLMTVNLMTAHLYLADLRGANLMTANLLFAILEGADLRGSDLSGAHLIRANLSRANLRDADLTNCRVTREQLEQVTSLKGAKLPFDMTPPPAPEVEVAAPPINEPQPPAPEVAPQNGQSQEKTDQHAGTENK